MRPFPGDIKEVPWKFLNDAVPMTGFKGLERTDRKSGEQYPKVSSHLTDWTPSYISGNATWSILQ